VRARQNSGLDGDLPDLVERAAVGTAVVLEHFVAEDALLQSVVRLRGGIVLLLGDSRNHLLLQFCDQRVALDLLVLFGIQRVGKVSAS